MKRHRQLFRWTWPLSLVVAGAMSLSINPSTESAARVASPPTTAHEVELPREALAWKNATFAAPVTTTTTRVLHTGRASRGATTSPVTQAPSTAGVTVEFAKMYIYNHESGNNPAARNGAGCRGLGQACPGSKLPCSDSDYACQDAWFTGYAESRYGGWINAYHFWLAHHWW